MAVTWEAGDLAVCVDARPNPRIRQSSGIQVGQVYRVAVVIQHAPRPNAVFGLTSVGLVLDGVWTSSKTGGFAAQRFRKIKPDAHEDCEPEFVELLKRSKVPACGPDYRQRMMLEALFGRMPPTASPRFRASHGAPADRHPSGFNRLSRGQR